MATLTCRDVGAAGRFQVRSWQSESGLPFNQISAILQTRDGYLWIGTPNGLIRFDGNRFLVFDSNNTPQMSDSGVTYLFQSKDDKLWIGHATDELTCFTGGHFTRAKLPSDSAGSRTRAIGQDRYGDIWILNVSGELVRQRDGRTYTAPSGPARGLLQASFLPDGTIWIARGGKLSEFIDGRFVQDHIPPDVRDSYVQGICPGIDGGIWIVSEGRTRKCQDGSWTADLGVLPWEATPFMSFIQTKSKKLLAGTADHGMYVIGTETGTTVEHFDRLNGLASDWISCLVEDREGCIWVGSGNFGLSMMKSKEVEVAGPPDDWGGRAVLSVTSAHDGSLWVGTEGGGLYRSHDGLWDHFAKNENIRNPYIWSVIENSEGVIYAGTWGGGLYSNEKGGFQKVADSETSCSNIAALLNGRDHGLWLGTSQGLMRYSDGKISSVAAASAIPDVRAIAEAPDGTLWFGSYGSGLGRSFNGETKIFRKLDGLPSNFVQCLYLDHNGVLWVGTAGGGLARIKEGKCVPIGQAQGLRDMHICAIAEDTFGFLWVSSLGGVMRLKKTELEACADGLKPTIDCLPLGTSDGMPTLQCSGGLQSASCASADGKLWFATRKGLISIDPASIELNPLKPPVVIESVMIDDKAPDPANPIRIPPGRHRIVIAYTGLSFSGPEKMEFRTWLDGLGDSRRSPGPLRVTEYDYLPPGKYSFHVTASNNDGVWNESGASVDFEILPFFWQTLYFRISAGAALFALMGWAVWFRARVRMNGILREIEQQRAIEQERARIAHDIHDDLGSYLTRITMLSETAIEHAIVPASKRGIRQIYLGVRELTQAVDEIVWAVNPRHDTFEGISDYLEKFAMDFLSAGNLSCRLNLPSHYPPLTISPVLRHNLFLAFKEALNNVVKHAQASEVQIAVSLEDERLTIIIEDDGRGFSAPTPLPRRSSRGNGLTGMQKRLTDVGGTCLVSSRLGSGTTVTLVAAVGKEKT